MSSIPIEDLYVDLRSSINRKLLVPSINRLLVTENHIFAKDFSSIEGILSSIINCSKEGEISFPTLDF